MKLQIIVAVALAVILAACATPSTAPHASGGDTPSEPGRSEEN